MTNDDTIQDIFQKICDRLERYSKEKRATTLPYQLEFLRKLYPSYKYDPQNEIIRESLIEHVGSLPIVATTLYPYLEDEDINLGEALIMLSIHDIGELVTGDKITFLKGDETKEQEEGVKLLNPIYHDYYQRIENPNPSDKTALFAKSIDKITPDFIDYLTPSDVTLQRYKSFMGTDSPQEIIDMKIEHKMPSMLWNNTIKNLFEQTIDQTLKKLKS